MAWYEAEDKASRDHTAYIQDDAQKVRQQLAERDEKHAKTVVRFIHHSYLSFIHS